MSCFQFTRHTCWGILILLASMAPASAAWTAVGDGIDYQYYRTSHPCDVYVARLTKSNANAIIDSSIAHDRIAGARQIVSSQAARQDGALNAWGSSWGPTNDAVVAINGSYFNLYTGVITGGHIYSGWYAKRFEQYSGQMGFVWKRDRSSFIGQCPNTTNNQQTITWGSGGTQYITGVNVERGSNDLILYTPQYDYYTRTDGTGSEVVVQVNYPTMLTTTGISGTVIERRQSQGSTRIPFDCVVLSAKGDPVTTLLNKATVGATLTIRQTVDHYINNCNDAGPSFLNSYALTQGNHVFLRSSTIIPNSDAGFVNRNPRTAVAYDANYVYFVVVDGRSTQSVGMSITELGAFCRDTLGATDATNQDGGGSSVMWINGSVVNVPSDGSERTVANGLMMINVQPKVQSTTFTAGQQVTTNMDANVRLGPGTNYYNYTYVTNGTTGTIQSHSLNGVYAKGYYWWKCNFSGTVGWVAESLLTVPAVAPTITQQPMDTTVAFGATAVFNVAASGTAPLYYQWQKDGVNLSNGNGISGATSTQLSITDVQTADEGGYRCVVSNAYGSVNSDTAILTATTCTPPSLLNGSFEGGNTNGVATSWTGYQRATNPTTVWTIQTASPPTGAGVQYQQIANTSSTGGGGVRQDITGCTVGVTYTIAGWMRTNSASATCTVKCSTTASTSWSTAIDLSPAQTTTSNTWVPFSGEVMATGTSMTLWLDGHTGGTGLNKASCFDGVTVTGCSAVPPPTITQHPGAQSACSGGTANFTVSATGDGTLTYQWQKNSVNLTNGGHYSGCTTETLTISSVDSNDVTNYRCVVTNIGGSTTSNQAALTLKAATTITGHPSNQSVATGGTANFSVTATGDGTLTYQWQKDAVNLTNGGHYSGCTTATMTVSSADSNDAAGYRCVVTGGCGSATSNAATLTITSCATPTLLNGTFEGGNTNGVATSWTGYQRPTNPTTVWSIQTASPPTGGGLQYQQIANTSATGGGGVRQNATGCTAGASYTIAGWMRTNSASATCTVKCSPSASTDWSTAANLSPAQTTTSNTWVPFSGTITATGTSMTIWLDGHTGGTGLNKAACFDSVTISCTP